MVTWVDRVDGIVDGIEGGLVIVTIASMWATYI